MTGWFRADGLHAVESLGRAARFAGLGFRRRPGGWGFPFWRISSNGGVLFGGQSQNFCVDGIASPSFGLVAYFSQMLAVAGGEDELSPQ